MKNETPTAQGQSETRGLHTLSLKPTSKTDRKEGAIRNLSNLKMKNLFTIGDREKSPKTDSSGSTLFLSRLLLPLLSELSTFHND